MCQRDVTPRQTVLIEWPAGRQARPFKSSFSKFVTAKVWLIARLQVQLREKWLL
jgi:hypothetical protein